MNGPSHTMVAVLNARANCVHALEDKLPQKIVKHLSSYPNLQRDFDSNSKGIFTRSILVRSLYYESCLMSHAHSVGQILLLSSGLDTRVLQSQQCIGKQIYNVDYPSSQDLTKTIFKKAGINDASYNYVPFDLTGRMSDLGLELENHGFNTEIPTLVIWEGSTFYFEPMIVYNILAWFYHNVSQIRMYFDFANKEFYQKAMSENVQIRSSSEILEKVGEPWIGLLIPEELGNYTRELGFQTKIIDRSIIEEQMLEQSKLPPRSIYFAELEK